MDDDGEYIRFATVIAYRSMAHAAEPVSVTIRLARPLWQAKGNQDCEFKTFACNMMNARSLHGELPPELEPYRGWWIRNVLPALTRAEHVKRFGMSPADMNDPALRRGYLSERLTAAEKWGHVEEAEYYRQQLAAD